MTQQVFEEVLVLIKPRLESMVNLNEENKFYIKVV